MAELTPRMKELVQSYLTGIEPYDPNFTPTRINLSANENTYPVPAGVREAVDAALAAGWRTPDLYKEGFKKADTQTMTDVIISYIQ